jgi:hypothetical protein
MVFVWSVVKPSSDVSVRGRLSDIWFSKRIYPRQYEVECSQIDRDIELTFALGCHMLLFAICEEIYCATVSSYFVMSSQHLSQG